MNTKGEKEMAAGSQNFYNRQDPPNTVKVEMTEGCSLFCSFCGIRGIRKSAGDFKFLTTELATLVAKKIKRSGWRSKIEFTMHGEPTMNPDYVKIIKIFRSQLPNSQLMITSNGTGLLKGKEGPAKNILALKGAGLNILALDDYKYAKIVSKIIAEIKGNKDFPVYYYPQQKNNPNVKRKTKDFSVIIIDDISGGKVGTRTLSNHCGCSAPLNSKRKGKRCARPFRELVIRWDGNVSICCNDWRGVFCCGNIKDNNVEEIWQGKEFHAVRQKLYRGERDFAPCHGCDSVSYRVGLLPDKLGKKTMSLPCKETDKIIKEVLSRPNLTVPVFRSWEAEGWAEGVKKYL